MCGSSRVRCALKFGSSSKESVEKSLFIGSSSDDPSRSGSGSLSETIKSSSDCVAACTKSIE